MLSNEELLAELKDLAKRDREGSVEILLRLAEMDRRRLYADVGFPSLWEFCRQVLRFSESVTGKRIAAARALVKRPEMEAMLRSGELSVCAVAMLAPHLDREDAPGLVERACGMSKRQLADMLSVRKGAKAKPDEIRRVVAEEVEELRFEMDGPALTLEREVLKTHQVTFGARTQLVENLDRLKELLGRAELDEVLLKATEALLDKVDPVRRHAKRVRRQARPAPQPAQRRFFAIADQDAGYVRDGGRCTYVAEDGRRCAARAFIQNDHIRPWALGGRSVARNHRLLCRCHNQMMARRSFS